MSNYYIPEPCHENWNKMTPQEQGRHCDVCSKVVVDFTQKSPSEIDNILDGQENVCGHFRVGQLNREAQMKVFKQPRNIFNRNIKYLALTVLGFFIIHKKTEAQTKGRVKISGGLKPVDHQLYTNTATKLTGTVLTPEHKPAGGAVITFSVNGKELGRTVSRANGTYDFSFSNGDIPGMRVDILVTHKYYLQKDIQGLELRNQKNTLHIVLEEEMMIIGKIAMPVHEEEVIPVSNDSVANETPVKVCNLQEITASEETATDTTQKEKTETIPAPMFNVRDEDIAYTIYPNPANEYATVQCHQTATYLVELYDAKGNRHMQVSFTGDHTNLNVSTLARGTYFVRLMGESGKTQILRLVRQ